MGHVQQVRQPAGEAGVRRGLVAGQPVEFQPRDIDSSIVLTGTARQIERVLWLSLAPDTVGGAPDPATGVPRWYRPHTPGPRWRSITQALDRSGLGVDLSTAEYLEFWVLEDANRTAAAAGTTLPLDFGTLEQYGCFIGSHAVVILSDQDDVKAVALNLMKFFEDESCGQCTPCRAGTEKAVKLMAKGPWNPALLTELSAAMRDASICGLGQAAPNPLLSVLKYFPEELKTPLGSW